MKAKVKMPELERETEKAWGFDIGEGRIFEDFTVKITYFPKSLCEYNQETDELTVPEWLAKKYGMDVAIEYDMGEWIDD